ncbi:MAG: hypothetical protein KGH67_03070 [Candidatus Micrarchaeota archaeon]|nr:hypothetical protein [Candidatus Micrarchaeota archaeon]MDE1859485.1 hypothetical protein [Candidatus Micrarchaeota archaeon]
MKYRHGTMQTPEIAQEMRQIPMQIASQKGIIERGYGSELSDALAYIRGIVD